MELITLFAAAGIIIFIGFAGEWIFEKTNIPDVIWLMLLGIVVGYFVDNSDPAFTKIAPIFTTFAMIFILFEGALHIDLKQLATGLVGGSSLALLNFIITLLIVPITMVVTGWSLIESILLGAIIGGVSSAVVIPLTRKIHIKSRTALILNLESAISDVLCIVGTITIVNIILLRSFSVSFVLQRILYSFAIGAILGIIGGLSWVKLHQSLDKISKSYMTTIAAMLLLYSFVQYLDSNGAIACLAFGIVLGNSKKIFSFLEHREYTLSNSAKFFFSEISFFLKTFFFVYLGLIINFNNLTLIFMGFLITLLLFLVRPLAVKISMRKAKFEAKDLVIMESLNPKGLAAAVLAQLPVQNKIIYGDQFSTIVLSVIIFSILLSTISVFLAEKGKFRGINQLLDIRPLINKIRS